MDGCVRGWHHDHNHVGRVLASANGAKGGKGTKITCLLFVVFGQALLSLYLMEMLDAA
jgi:hypothetical protein